MQTQTQPLLSTPTFAHVRTFTSTFSDAQPVHAHAHRPDRHVRRHTLYSTLRHPLSGGGDALLVAVITDALSCPRSRWLLAEEEAELKRKHAEQQRRARAEALRQDMMAANEEQKRIREQLQRDAADRERQLTEEFLRKCRTQDEKDRAARAAREQVGPPLATLVTAVVSSIPVRAVVCRRSPVSHPHESRMLTRVTAATMFGVAIAVVLRSNCTVCEFHGGLPWVVYRRSKSTSQPSRRTSASARSCTASSWSSKRSSRRRLGQRCGTPARCGCVRRWCACFVFMC